MATEIDDNEIERLFWQKVDKDATRLEREIRRDIMVGGMVVRFDRLIEAKQQREAADIERNYSDPNICDVFKAILDEACDRLRRKFT